VVVEDVGLDCTGIEVGKREKVEKSGTGGTWLEEPVGLYFSGAEKGKIVS